ncbi:MAG TPA: CPBP family intramembrane glutamic endopeptidase [Candidatus Sulfotelmatobacter sp.]|nr:CPBP family intramembrane glutamic endopeptidase [Candidatus Sulfotelmatobacter sp.]
MPFVSGIVAALLASAIGVVASLLGVLVVMVAVVLAIGRMPSAEAGHPLLTATELIFYGCAGAFAWHRLQKLRPGTLRVPNRQAMVVIAIGVAALLLTRVLLAMQLVFTRQTNHVQAGFEHYSIVTHDVLVTDVNVALSLFSLVLLGPFVEEVVFRGLLFGALASKLGVFAGALLSAAIFGALHGDPVLFAWLAAVGLVNAFAYAATGNLTVPIVLHALSNALGASVLLETSLHAMR